MKKRNEGMTYNKGKDTVTLPRKQFLDTLKCLSGINSRNPDIALPLSLISLIFSILSLALSLKLFYNAESLVYLIFATIIFIVSLFLLGLSASFITSWIRKLNSEGI